MCKTDLSRVNKFHNDLLIRERKAPSNLFETGCVFLTFHYCDTVIGAVASQITSLTIVYSTVYSDADQRKHQSSASLASVRGIHRRPVNSPHKWPVTRKMFPFDDVIMREDPVGIIVTISVYLPFHTWATHLKIKHPQVKFTGIRTDCRKIIPKISGR